MRKSMKLALPAITLLLLGTTASAQKLPKSIYIQAQAMGTQTQMGRSASITIIINEWSPAADQKVLLDTFQEKGNEGLVNALSKMPSKGRIAITGTLGGDIAYARKFTMPDGSTRIRVVTNRLLRFGEVWSDSRSSDYQLSGADITLSKNKGKSSGTLIPAAQLKLNKEGQMEIEAFQFPWNLVNIQLR